MLPRITVRVEKEISSRMQLEHVYQANQYQSYVVRFWQSEGTGVWRASAQNVQNGALVLFADAESLFAFLQTQIATEATQGASDEQVAMPANNAG